MSPEIVKWSVKESANAIYRAVADAKKLGEKIPTKKHLLEIGEAERLRLLRMAGKKGTAVHNYTLTPSLDAPEEYQAYYTAFENFVEENPLTPILQERVICSHTFKFAGRFDNYCELWGKKVLIDYKTSNYLRSEYGLQLAAYAHCLIKAGYPVDATYILHLKKDGTWNLVKYQDLFEDFLVIREAFARKVAIEKPPFEIASDFNAMKHETQTKQPKPRPEEEELDPKELEKYVGTQKIPRVD